MTSSTLLSVGLLKTFLIDFGVALNEIPLSPNRLFELVQAADLGHEPNGEFGEFRSQN